MFVSGFLFFSSRGFMFISVAYFCLREFPHMHPAQLANIYRLRFTLCDCEHRYFTSKKKKKKKKSFKRYDRVWKIAACRKCVEDVTQCAYIQEFLWKKIGQN